MITKHIQLWYLMPWNNRHLWSGISGTYPVEWWHLYRGILKKLKQIVEASEHDTKLFILLDEILRATNSNDRHKGTTALVTQLLKQHASGLLATHDIALTDLAKNFPDNIQNYHFDVQVSNEELKFDYKIKEGICQNMNATILMREIGIKL